VEKRFDEIAKALAGGCSRREAFRRVLALAAGAVLAGIGLPGGARAQGSGGTTTSPCCPKNRVCPVHGSTTPPICCPDGTVCVPTYSDAGVLTGGVCCKTSQICGSRTAGYHCCPDGQMCIEGKCRCPDGSVATADGRCCPRASVCGSICCPTDTTCIKTANGPVCCASSKICGSSTAPICCPDGQVCIEGKCRCPSGTTVCGDRLCCPEGSICLPVPGALPVCCPKQRIIRSPNGGYACCPDGLVASSDHTTCVCPDGTHPCGDSTASAPVCCPKGSICLPSTNGAMSCCPTTRIIHSPTGGYACCPDGLVSSSDHMRCVCPDGSVMTADGVCCKKAQVCVGTSTDHAICCAEATKCAVVEGRPTCVCPKPQTVCHSPIGYICCPPSTVCLG
jgi:hypothetical protein